MYYSIINDTFVLKNPLIYFLFINIFFFNSKFIKYKFYIFLILMKIDSQFSHNLKYYWSFFISLLYICMLGSCDSSIVYSLTDNQKFSIRTKIHKKLSLILIVNFQSLVVSTCTECIFLALLNDKSLYL